MIGLKKDYAIVIMDGSDINVVNNIVGVVEMVTKPLFHKNNCEPIDKQHPTMLAVKFRANRKAYANIQAILQKQFPALCTFDVAV
ncbi:MAG: hypothetical protein PHS74_00575 [Lachnospiraceae bacterium]|nr:hypothetical protein [Lachnospiraceae bacterium]